MAAQPLQAYKFDLSGGHLALDFINTVSRRDAPELSVDHIRSASDLLSFALQSKLINPEDAARLSRAFAAKISKSAELMRNTIALREALFRTFHKVAAGGRGLAADILLIEKWNAEALVQRKIVHANGRYSWKWDDQQGAERILWPIAQAAADLLTSEQLEKVRECEASDCAWLFLDTSRNHSRRWCDMSVCGNREKARRHYQRQHSSK